MSFLKNFFEKAIIFSLVLFGLYFSLFSLSYAQVWQASDNVTSIPDPGVPPEAILDFYTGGVSLPLPITGQDLTYFGLIDANIFSELYGIGNTPTQCNSPMVDGMRATVSIDQISGTPSGDVAYTIVVTNFDNTDPINPTPLPITGVFTEMTPYSQTPGFFPISSSVSHILPSSTVPDPGPQVFEYTFDVPVDIYQEDLRVFIVIPVSELQGALVDFTIHDIEFRFSDCDIPTPTPSQSSSSSRRTGSRVSPEYLASIGIVLGNTSGQELTETPSKEEKELACPYIHTFLRYGYLNDTGDTIRLQEFLNKYMNTNLEINGVFTLETDIAVRNFQSRYKNEILTPWGLTSSTGWVYKTTQGLINHMMGCSVEDRHLNRVNRIHRFNNISLFGILRE